MNVKHITTRWLCAKYKRAVKDPFADIEQSKKKHVYLLFEYRFPINFRT